ncbi:MAG: hypothetical protein M3264_09690, partial [Thermoproteota archaeon]|nr:hypothetical protein [Thermoproteota archaeon]
MSIIKTMVSRLPLFQIGKCGNSENTRVCSESAGSSDPRKLVHPPNHITTNQSRKKVWIEAYG